MPWCTRQPLHSVIYSPESVATILAICARSLLSSSCRAVVRFSAVTPGFLRPSIRLPSRRKLGTEEFLWSTRSGVGLHSCFRGRQSLLRTDKRTISKSVITFISRLSFPNLAPLHKLCWWLDTYRTLAYVSSSSATIQAISAKVGTIGPSVGRRGPNPGNSLSGN